MRHSNLTMQKIVKFAILLCFYSRRVAATHCYPDYCHISTNQTPASGFRCSLTSIQTDEGCSLRNFENFNAEPSKDKKKATFILRAYVYKELENEVTAFNLTVTDADFHRLVTRYQNLWDENQSACRNIELYGNDTYPAPKELYVSCPFSSRLYESTPYRLDYHAIAETYKYSRQYVFNVPQHKFIREGTNVRDYTPFVYIDVSFAPLLSLHIQPLPEAYNVTKYRIWLLNNDTDSVIYTDMFSVASKQDIWYNFTAHTGVFYFNVTAIHPDCGIHGCANSTTPIINIQETSHRLLIMIISTVWIPPVILYVLYHLYKLYRREALKRREKPKCLLVYSPTRLSHINVMIELAKYLRYCNVNAMIDMLDVADTTGKDPECWCNVAFGNADVVLIATSPPPKKPAVSTIYQNTDNYLLTLVKKNQCLREKRYYVLQLPYCKPDDVSEEMKHLKRFCLPKELPKLVKTIYKMEHLRCVSVSDKEFLDSVKLAKLEILEEDASVLKETHETENLLTAESAEVAKRRISVPTFPGGNGVSQSFATNVDELNLLGESEKAGDMLAYKYSPNDDASFRIENLNL